MPKKLSFFFSTLATKDLQLLLDFLVLQKEEDMYQLIVNRIGETLDFLCEFPNIGIKISKSNSRQMPVQKTKYLIRYRVKNNQLEVLRIYHSSQDWK